MQLIPGQKYTAINENVSYFLYIRKHILFITIFITIFDV